MTQFVRIICKHNYQYEHSLHTIDDNGKHTSEKITRDEFSKLNTVLSGECTFDNGERMIDYKVVSAVAALV